MGEIRAGAENPYRVMSQEPAGGGGTLSCDGRKSAPAPGELIV